MGLVGSMSICIMIMNSSSSCFPSWIIHITSFSIVTKGFVIFFGWKDPCQELWFMHWQLLNILFIRNKIFSLWRQYSFFKILFHLWSYRYLTYLHIINFFKVMVKACKKFPMFQFNLIHFFLAELEPVIEDTYSVKLVLFK